MMHRLVRTRAICPAAPSGSALIIVLTFIVLLAMMGTIFLVAMRLSREQITGIGSGLVGTGDGSAAWPGNDKELQYRLGEARQLIFGLSYWAIEDAVVPGHPDSPANYRSPTLATPLLPTTDFVHPAHPRAVFLASRMPERSYLDPEAPLWRHISQLAIGAPGFGPGTPLPFTTPITPTTVRNPDVFPETPLPAAYSYTARSELRPATFRITYPQTHPPLPSMARRNRAFPALVRDTGGIPILAADVDGDGIADAALFDITEYPEGDFNQFLAVLNAPYPADEPRYKAIPPLALNTPAGTRYVTFFAALRIVDNSGGLDILTSISRAADRDGSGSPIPNNPLLGTFRPNVGFYELFRSGTLSQVVPDPGLDARFDTDRIADLNADHLTLQRYRFNALQAYCNIINEDGTPVRDAVFYSQGEAIERQLITRRPGGYNGSTSTRFYHPPLHSEVDYRFGLHNFTMPFVSGLKRDAPYLFTELTPNYARLPYKRFSYFGAPHVDFWFNTIVDNDSTPGGFRERFFTRHQSPNNDAPFPHANFNAKSALHHLVANSSSSSLIPDHLAAFNALPASVKTTDPYVQSYNPNLMPRFDGTPPLASVNLSAFGELWRAYWNVFQSGGSSIAQIRSAARHNTPGWTHDHQRLTRAALAAVNTLTLLNPEQRDATPGATFVLDTDRLPTARAESRTFTVDNFEVTVYGVRKQPFLTEILVEKNDQDVPTYLGIELYNPYNAPISLRNWRLATLEAGTLFPVAAPFTNQSVPAGGFLVLEAGTRPTNTGPGNQFPLISIQGTTINLGTSLMPSLFGKELVLLRPRRDDGNYSASSATNDTYDEFSNIHDLIPVDHANLTPRNPNPRQRERFKYVRPMDSANPFVCVRAADRNGTALPLLTEDGDHAGTLGALNPDSTMHHTISVPLATFFAERLNPIHRGSPANPNRFPFGGFARDGDMLHVPFIGHYRIRHTITRQILELNAVTADAMFADDQRPANDDIEQVGRFTPVSLLDPSAAQDGYYWAANIFSYLTANQSVREDYTPYVRPDRYNAAPGNTVPQPVDNVPNDPPEVNEAAEGRMSILGKININTAPWQVLNTLPLIVPDSANPRLNTPAKVAIENERLAKAIVTDRNLRGPFPTIAHLNRVPANVPDPTTGLRHANVAFQDAAGNILAPMTLRQGDLSPADGVANPNGLVGDFEQRMMAFTRISNLITTHSNSFRVEILVQAWLDAGTPHAVMLRESR